MLSPLTPYPSAATTAENRGRAGKTQNHSSSPPIPLRAHAPPLRSPDPEQRPRHPVHRLHGIRRVRPGWFPRAVGVSPGPAHTVTDWGIHFPLPGFPSPRLCPRPVPRTGRQPPQGIPTHQREKRGPSPICLRHTPAARPYRSYPTNQRVRRTKRPFDKARERSLGGSPER